MVTTRSKKAQEVSREPAAGGPLQRAMRLSHQHFPTESLSNMLRPLGLADGHALHDVFNLATLPLLVYECCRYLSTGARFDEFLLVTCVRGRAPQNTARARTAERAAPTTDRRRRARARASRARRGSRLAGTATLSRIYCGC
jgi:hypothetical protein